MPELFLDIHGISAQVSSESARTLEGLRRDFEYFESSAGTSADVRLELSTDEPPAGSRSGRRWLATSEFSAADSGRTRRIDYCDGAAAIYDFSRETGALYCPREERLHELGYLAILSRVGEALDRRGLHRVHALGFEFGGQGGLLLLPSGGGKSTLALELLAASSRLGILSDDSPFIDADGLLRAMPLRWAFLPTTDLSAVPGGFIRPFSRRRFGPKRVVDVGYFRQRVRDRVPLRWLLVGRRDGAGPKIEPLSFAAGLGALFVNLVVGHGLAQMAEYRLRTRPADLLGLAGDAARRLRAAVNAVSMARLGRFTLGPDPKASARALLAYLEAKA
jgi:hypothetical protein